MSAHSHSPDQDLLSLLRSKNRCLERLLTATRALLSQPVENLTVASSEGSEADTLTAFNRQRESVLRALELYDRKINDLIPRIPPAMRSESFLAETKNEMSRNGTLIATILGADELVFQRLAEAQARIQKLASESRRSKEMLGKFKSSWVTESGEEMDQTL